MNWTELPLFKGINLNDSFVLGWTLAKDKLVFVLEASIWPESRYYLPPNHGEYTCYRKATIEFIDTISIMGLQPMESTPFSVDPDGSKDYGNIDSLTISNVAFNICGDFGEVKIQRE